MPRWCLFRGGEIAVERIDGRASLPRGEAIALSIDETKAHYVGMVEGEPCFAAALPEEQALPAGAELLGLRPLILEGDEAVSGVAGLAFQVLEWERTHRYCGTCGKRTEAHGKERARKCTSCRQTYYPRIAPVVMGLVTRGRELLLTRKPGYKAGRYTVVAGFVEPGETLEHAVAREVQEETGVAAANARYIGSQPWPFPNPLVMAFTLDYQSGEAKADGVELEEARWFDVDDLPDLPERVHISRRLIEAAVARLTQGPA